MTANEVPVTDIDSDITVNGEEAEFDVAEFTSDPYVVTVGASVGRDDAEDGGGVYRQIRVATEGHGEDCPECGAAGCDPELLLSLDEARALRDRLAQAIVLAARAPEPEVAP